MPKRTRLTVALLVLACAGGASRAAAQASPPEAASPPATATEPVAERLAPVPPAPGLFDAPRESLAADRAEEPLRAHEGALQPLRSGKGATLAIVGGALFAAGLIAGGDAGTVMVLAGAGIGAYGLYLMLR